MSRAKLDHAQIDKALMELDGWTISKDGKAIDKVFKFKNFISAFGFMTKVALVAEKMDHHPDWSNVYRTVNVTLNTHDAGGVTQLDLDLAKAMDSLA